MGNSTTLVTSIQCRIDKGAMLAPNIANPQALSPNALNSLFYVMSRVAD